jgi:hypothetical protein
MKILVLFPLLFISIATFAINKPLTKKLWNGLTKEQQKSIVITSTYDGGEIPYSNYAIIEYKDHSFVTNPKHEGYLKELYSVISNKISFDNIDQSLGSETGYAIITRPIIHLTVLVTKDTDEILGTSADIYFQGAYKEEITDKDNQFYFMSKQEAIKNGFDPDQDISWSAGLFFSANASLFPNELLTFEWSGW